MRLSRSHRKNYIVQGILEHTGGTEHWMIFLRIKSLLVRLIKDPQCFSTLISFILHIMQDTDYNFSENLVKSSHTIRVNPLRLLDKAIVGTLLRYLGMGGDKWACDVDHLPALRTWAWANIWLRPGLKPHQTKRHVWLNARGPTLSNSMPSYGWLVLVKASIVLFSLHRFISHVWVCMQQLGLQVCYSSSRLLFSLECAPL